MRLKKILFALSLFLLLPSCIEAVAVSVIGTGYLVARDTPVAQSLDDGKISSRLTTKLILNNLYGAYSKVNVTTNNGRVLLTGYVKDKSFVRKAMAYAWEINGVSEVINEINVGDDAKKRNYPLDNLIANRLKTKLILDKEIDSLDVNIDVYDQTVFLLGYVRSDEENRQVSEIAARLKGVKKVISHLRIDA